MTRRRSALIVWIAGSFASLAAFGVALAVGPAPWSLAELWRMAQQGDAAANAILVHIRGPRALGAWLVGACLSLAGVLLQTATHNPVADPYLMGTSAGATLAAVALVPLCLVIGDWAGISLGGALPWLQTGAAFVGALAAVAVTFALARGRQRSAERVLVGGLVITAFGGAATSFVLTQLSDVRLRAATQWLMGGVALPDLASALPGLLAVALALGWSLANLPQLQALGLGDEAAHGLGLDAARIGRRAMALAALLSAVAVALAGIVGFVGLLVPHALRLALGRDPRLILPGSVLLGGAALVLLDAVCRVAVAPAELPLGILTALMGAPVLVLLLRDRRGGTMGATTAILPMPSEGQPYIAMQNLTVTTENKRLLSDISAQWHGPAVVALVGPNGSGKTSLLRTLAGLWPLERGSLTGMGGAAALATGRCAYLPQDLTLPADCTVLELVATGRHRQLARDWGWRLQGRIPPSELPRLIELLTRVSLADRADSPVQQLSGGERQRTLLAMALACEAKVLLLDEPTASLDWAQARSILQDLHHDAHAAGLLVVVTLHDLPLAVEWADALAVLDGGRLLATGTPDDPTVRAAVLAVLGAQLPAAPVRHTLA